MPIGQILHLENSFPLHNFTHSALKSFQIFDFQTNNPLPLFLVFTQFQLTFCICEVRAFIAGQAGPNTKVKNKLTNYDQMVTDVGQVRTNDSKRSNAHCFNVLPVFCKCNVEQNLR